MANTNTPSLSKKQFSHLRSLSHHLNAVVMIGNRGLTDSVLSEIDRSLSAHELIKIQVSGDDREARKAIYEAICESTNATAVHHIGKQLVIFRPSEQQKIALPD